jgi:predicted nucleic acid-binding Zn ribbon protein
MDVPSALDHRAQSVATPLCPVCHTVPLTGKQLVCSPKCRIQKSMATREAKRQNRDAKARLLLREALELLDDDEEPQQHQGGRR